MQLQQLSVGKNQKKTGFTLIELLVVIAIIGVLSSLIIVGIISGQGKARDTKRKANARNVDIALAQYKVDNNAFPIQATSGGVVVETIQGNLSPTYMQGTGSFTHDRAAKYVSNGTGSMFAQAWELERPSETVSNSGNGIYSTDASSTAGTVSVGNTTTGGTAYNGTTQSASLPDHAAFSFAGNFTVSFWTKPIGALVNDAALVEKWAQVGSYPYAFRVNSGTNSVKFLRYNGTTAATAIGSTNITTGGNNGWHHIVGLKNGANISLIIDNGAAVTVADVSGTTNNAVATFLGMRGSSTQYFSGQIADLRIFSTNLTTGAGSQVEALYNSGSGVYGGSSLASLIAMWRLDEVSGATLVNSGPSSAISPPSAVNGTLSSTGVDRYIISNLPLGLTGIGSSLTGRAFVSYGPQ